MKLSSEIYESIVEDETSRRILDYCKNPRTSLEVKSDVFHSKQANSPDNYSSISDVEGYVGTRLEKLEKIGALKFREGKWQTTPDATTVLDKYFGR